MYRSYIPINHSTSTNKNNHNRDNSKVGRDNRRLFGWIMLQSATSEVDYTFFVINVALIVLPLVIME